MDDITPESIIGGVYEAVGQPDKWQEVLYRIKEVTGAGSGCILSTSSASKRGNVNCFHNIDPEWIAAYNDWYHQYDPSPALLSEAPGRVHVDPVTGPRLSDIRGDARVFYHEVMRPQRFRHTLHVGLSGTTERSLGMIFQRSPRQGAFENQAVDALSRIAPHLQRALQLHARVQTVNGLSVGMAAVLDQTPMGVLLLGRAGHVLHANSKAERILQKTGALRITSTGLEAAGRNEQPRLKALIAAALGERLEPQCGAMIRLHDENGIPALRVQVTPLHVQAQGDPLAPGDVRAAVWVGGYESMQLCPETLSLFYELTRAESELLARLVEGWTLSDIAGLRQVRESTVRTQLKTLMTKLGVSRQVDLVRLVLSGPAAVVPV